MNITNVIFSSLESETLALLTKGGVYITGGGVKIYGVEDYIADEVDKSQGVIEGIFAFNQNDSILALYLSFSFFLSSFSEVSAKSSVGL